MFYLNCCYPKKKDNTIQNTVYAPSTEDRDNFLSESNLELHNANYRNTIKFIPNIKIGKVIKVYDGDTITIAAKICKCSNVYRFNIRLMEIDTPELRTSNENEKKAARFVQRRLEDLIMNKIVETKIIGTDKYGRLLGFVYVRLEDGVQINISRWLLDNRYGVFYDGGKKKTPEDWIDYMKINLNDNE